MISFSSGVSLSLCDTVFYVTQGIFLYLSRYSYFIAYYRISTEFSKCTFKTRFLQHWRSNDHIRPFRKTLWHIFCDTDDSMTINGNSEKPCHSFWVTQKFVRFDSHLSWILVKWWSNKTLASMGLIQVHPQ